MNKMAGDGGGGWIERAQRRHDVYCSGRRWARASAWPLNNYRLGFPLQSKISALRRW